MPVFIYKCPCGWKGHKVYDAEKQPKKATCCKCWKETAVTDGERVNAFAGLASGNDAYSRPMLSDSLGVAPKQIAEAQQRFPHHEFLPDGRMVIRSHSQYKRVLKDLGFADKNKRTTSPEGRKYFVM
jgi:hypothetical protein